MTAVSLSLPGHVHWPPPILLIAAVLLIGAVLLTLSIAMRRTSGSPNISIAASLLLLMAAIWNGAIVFAFMSPRNRHVFHLATHRTSVFVNAAVGAIWFSLCVLCVIKWFYRSNVPQRT